MRWLDGITDSVDMGLGGQYFGCIPEMDDRQGGLASFGAWGSKVSDRTERLHFHALEKEMATHSSVLAWRIPGTGAW